MGETDERYTPHHVLQVVRDFAPIALDPCAPMHNPVAAIEFMTAQTDGLARPWGSTADGCVFVNPPYGRGQLQRWADRIVTEAHAGREIIMLTPCDLGTRWATALFCGGWSALAFWRGRIAFELPAGLYSAGAKQPSCFWYFGRRSKRYMRVFSGHANVIAS